MLPESYFDSVSPIELPTNSSPIWSSRAGDSATSSGRFGDDVWNLAETERDGEYTEAGKVKWNRFPMKARATMKILAWLLINEGVPHSFVSHHGKATVRVLTAVSNGKNIRIWANLHDWLAKRGIWDIALISNQDWLEFADQELVQKGAKHQVSMLTLLALSRLWILSERLHLGVTRPPWYGSDDLAEFVPPEKRQAENLTAVIPMEVISPMLAWAISFVDDFSTDIFAAKEEADRIRQASIAPEASTSRLDVSSVTAWYHEQMELGQPIPCKPDGSISFIFLGAQFGVSSRWLAANTTDVVRRYAQDRPGPCTLSTSVQGMRDGVLWRDSLDFHDVPKYWRLLGTAALICIGYLTGMRLNELLNLKVGCCNRAPDSEHWIISGLASRKTAKVLLDESGQSDWIAIGHTARAIGVLETMVGTGALFSSEKLDLIPRRAKGRARAITCPNVNARLREFLSFVRAEEGLQPTAVTEGEDRPFHFKQFRRTLAYYIARRPGGMIALAVQYNHMRWITSEGYASRRRDGFTALLEVETARAAAETLIDIADALENDGVISGPGSVRIRTAAENFQHVFRGRVLTRAEALRFFDIAEHRVYPNPDFFSLCHFDSAKALCRQGDSLDEPEQPRLHECRPGCGNLVHTDEYMQRASERARFLEERALSEGVSPLIANRITRNAERLRALVKRHEAKRLVD